MVTIEDVISPSSRISRIVATDLAVGKRITSVVKDVVGGYHSQPNHVVARSHRRHLVLATMSVLRRRGRDESRLNLVSAAAGIVVGRQAAGQRPKEHLRPFVQLFARLEKGVGLEIGPTRSQKMAQDGQPDRPTCAVAAILVFCCRAALLRDVSVHMGVFIMHH